MADPHVITALERKYAERRRDLRQLVADARTARTDLLHLEAVLRMFRSDWNNASVKPLKSRRPSRWMNRGEGVRAVLDVLREAQEPLTTHEIVQAVFARRGMPEPDAVTLRAAAGPIHKALRDRDGVIAFVGKPKRWAIAR